MGRKSSAKKDPERKAAKDAAKRTRQALNEAPARVVQGLIRAGRLQSDYRRACLRLLTAERRLDRLQSHPGLYSRDRAQYGRNVARVQQRIASLEVTVADLHAQLVALGVDPAEVEDE